MNFWQQIRNQRIRDVFAYLAPESFVGSPRRQVVVGIAVLLGVAAIGSALVSTPASPRKPDLWQSLHQHLSQRAQVDLFDDFRHGLDDWESGANRATTNWSYDRGGFVNVGALSLFEPSMRLTDYDLDALVQIESKGLGLVFRATSAQTYQAVKLRLEGSGPMRSLAVDRYAVIGGVASRGVFKRYPKPLQSDVLCRVHVAVRGDSFTLYVQDELIDYWSDPRLQQGGVGLYCSAGEHARAAWIRVSHNTDSIGRIYSFLSALLPAGPS